MSPDLHPECLAWKQRSEKVLAGGPATLSKMPARYPVGIAPSILVYGDGAYVTCPDYDRYIDTVAALGPVVLGYNDPAVNIAAMEQISDLTISTLTTPLETEVAEMLCAMIPGAERVRFATNGADVTNAAVKIARRHTGKRHIIFCGYMGGHDSYLSTTDKNGGINPSISNWNHQVPWRDFPALAGMIDGNCGSIPAGDDLAAIVLEVPPEAAGVTAAQTACVIEYYRGVAHGQGALFVLDEVVTGLRYGLGGAQEYYGVRADLVTMSKALGNGFPVSAILGHKDLMGLFTGGEVFLSTTFGAQPVGLAAARATLLAMQGRHGLIQLCEWGGYLREKLLEMIQATNAPCTLRGNYARMVLDWHGEPGVVSSNEIRTLWLQETAKRGVLFGVPIFPMCCYNERIATDILRAAGEVMALIAEAFPGEIGSKLEVPVIAEVFERYVPHVAEA